jgi:hypothetical protein
MTPQENEIRAMQEMAEWRLRKLVTNYGPLYESEAFVRSARGLRRSDWDEIVNKLLTEGFLLRTKSETQGVPMLGCATKTE